MVKKKTTRNYSTRTNLHGGVARIFYKRGLTLFNLAMGVGGRGFVSSRLAAVLVSKTTIIIKTSPMENVAKFRSYEL